jgi:hypothetical protein
MAMTVEIEVEGASGRQPLTLDIARVYNLGFTVRDSAKMDRHMEEVEKIGITRPDPGRPPIIFPISAWATIFDDECQVQYPRTSGEVEIVTIDNGGDILVTVGSDHTDRKLEIVSIPWSKQVAPNVVAPVAWRWEDVADHWDEITMECWVIDGGERVRYQHAGVNEFWTPIEMRDSIRGRINEHDGALVLFSGTVVTDDERFRYVRDWTIEMDDPVLGRRIEHTYRVTVLAEDILDSPGSTDLSNLPEYTHEP